MRNPPAITRLFWMVPSIVAAMAAPAFGGDAHSGESREEAQVLATQIRQIRESAATPEEMVARVDELLRARPQEERAVTRQSREPRPLVPGMSKEDALRIEARNVLKETRETARSPEEEVALVDEFLRLNVEALASLRPMPRSDAEKTAAEWARKEMLQSRVAKNPDDLLAEAALVLWEVRRQARSPEESVALTDEFLRLNRETLDTERRKALGDPSQNRTQK